MFDVVNNVDVFALKIEHVVCCVDDIVFSVVVESFGLCHKGVQDLIDINLSSIEIVHEQHERHYYFPLSKLFKHQSIF